MYSTKSAVKSANLSKYMAAGINENITITEVKIDKSPNGNDFIEITFADSDGRTVTMTEWKNKINSWIKDEIELQKRDDQQFGRILQVLECFYTEDKLQVELDSFLSMINWVKTMLNVVIPDKKPLRIKVVYDNKGFTTTSHNGIFIEPMDIEKSSVEKLPRDRFERPVIADAEVTTSDPLAVVNTTSTPEVNPENKTDNLPF